MILMHYFNRTLFEHHHTALWPWICAVFRVEMVLIGLNIVHTAFFLWINIKSNQFHKNWTRIMSLLYTQHIIADFAWIAQKVLLTSEEYVDPFVSRPFIITSYIRVFCVYVGLTILPTLVTERYFATIMFSNYEFKPRAHIFYLLVGLLVASGTTNAYTFHEYESSLQNFLFVLFLNSLGVLGNIFLLRINKKYYVESVHVSLTARYQLAENIKVCHLVNRIVLSMGAFNALICFTLLLDNFNLSIYSRSLSLFAFDVCALIYSTVFPYVCMHYCKRWRTVFMGVVKKIVHRQRSVAPYTIPDEKQRPSVVLHTTFGAVMTDASTEVHFRQLETSWNL